MNEGDKIMNRLWHYFIALIPVVITAAVLSTFIPIDTPLTGFLYGGASALGMAWLKVKVKKTLTV